MFTIVKFIPQKVCIFILCSKIKLFISLVISLLRYCVAKYLKLNLWKKLNTIKPFGNYFYYAFYYYFNMIKRKYVFTPFNCFFLDKLIKNKDGEFYQPR